MQISLHFLHSFFLIFARFKKKKLGQDKQYVHLKSETF